MNRKIILHFSTKDVSKARAFYLALGFTVYEQFSGDYSVCIILSDTISAMFSAEASFPILTATSMRHLQAPRGA